MNLLKEKALVLRKKGYSYRIINQKLHVSKSTLSNWLSRVPFTPNDEVIKKVGSAKLKSALYKQHLKFESIRSASQEARKDIGLLSKRDLFLLGIGLYLGEGEKSFENVRIVNSDPKIIRLAARWFREICAAPKENFRPSIHLYPDSSEEKALQFWSHILEVPVSQFGKTIIDRRLNKSPLKRRKLPHGTLHLRIASKGNTNLGVYLHRKIQGWMERCLIQI